MNRVEDNDYYYVNFYEKKSNLTMIFEKEKKEKYDNKLGMYIKTDETYHKYIKEYFSFMDLTGKTYNTKTEEIDVGATVIDILSNKTTLINTFYKYKNNILQANEDNGIQYIQDLICNLEKDLIAINKTYIVFTYLISCFIFEFNLDNNQFSKVRFSIATFLNNLIGELDEMENLVNLFFIKPKELYNDIDKMEQLEIYSRNTYCNNFIMPESNNIYKLYKYYPIITRTEYQISNLIDILYCTIYILACNQKTICRCNHCHKYFIPKNRNDTLNCSIECARANQTEALDLDYTEITRIYYRIVNYLNRHKKFKMCETFKNRYKTQKEKIRNNYEDKKLYIKNLKKWLLEYENKHISKT